MENESCPGCLGEAAAHSCCPFQLCETGECACLADEEPQQ
jgi:hypothetical protein